MKRMVAAVAVTVMMLTAGGAYAWWGGYGPGYAAAGTNVENLKKFQKETLNLRDELMTKEVDLQNEYAKAAPDTARIASLRKEIIDLETKIQAVAEKHGIQSAGCAGGPKRGRGPGCGMRAGGPGNCGCQAGW